MGAIVDIARRYEMKVLEDAAQAHGSLYHGRPAGTLGDAAAFSFYPGKNLGACGEGGAVTTNDVEIARQVRLLRDHGRATRYTHVIEGYNGRLDAMQAGFLLVKLKHLANSNQCRRQWAEIYDEAFRETKNVHPVVVQPDRVSCRHLYVVRSKVRDDLQQFLTRQEIATGVHYPVPLHLQPCYARLGYRKGDFPAAEAACEQVLSLPLFPEMSQTQIARVVDAVLEFEQTAGSPPASIKAA
jgi:dTDP-4-amino-4,6-dideoxygalactose transaminase